MSVAVIRESMPGGKIESDRGNGAAKHQLQRRCLDAHSGVQDRHEEILTGAGLLLATLLIMVLSAVLVWFAILRENQVFWTNAGGYPIWLRDLVLWTYIPLLGVAGLSLMALSMACFSRICRSKRFFAVEGLLLLMCWGLLATSGCMAFSNNIANIIEGRDLHFHPAHL